jgi:hypothetical protein
MVGHRTTMTRLGLALAADPKEARTNEQFGQAYLYLLSSIRFAFAQSLHG